MSAKSKSSRKRRPPKPRRRIDRPFAANVSARARELAEQYQVVAWFEDGRYFGRGLELPDTYGDGPTLDACFESVREGFVATLGYLLEQGQDPPAPARDEKRDQQVNLRLTALEKLRLETAARQKGYSGLSEYVRRAALADAE